MTWMLCICFILLACYAGLLAWLGSGFVRMRPAGPEPAAPPVPVTIIICARNEEKHIAACLSSILRQDYDPEHLQILVINDASTDATVLRAEAILSNSGIPYRLITNRQQKGKKQSISYAMPFASGELILLRDADTFTSSAQWLASIAGHYARSRADLIIAPVALANNSGILWALQAIENNILAVLAAGSNYYRQSFLCSGANLAFPKTTFERTNGYTSHIEQPSGDDIFFMEDVKKIPRAQISYLKAQEAIVSTYPCYSFAQLIRQKTRWASKFKVNQNKLNLVLALLSFTVNAAWLFCLVASYMVTEHQSLYVLFIFLKLLIDFLLLFLASGFIKNRLLWWFALPVGCVYPVYACLVSIAALFVKPKWK